MAQIVPFVGRQPQRYIDTSSVPKLSSSPMPIKALSVRTSSICLILALTTLGLSTPSCTDQTLLQTRLSEISNVQAELLRKFSALENKVTALTGELDHMKQLFPSIANAVQANADAQKNLNSAMAQIQEKLTAIEQATHHAVPSKKSGHHRAGS